MKTFYRLLFYLSLVSISRAESGDAGSEAQCARISLGEVTSIVLANNPAIQQALRKWSAAKARVTQEAAWDDLKVGGSSRAARFVDIAPNSFTDQTVSVEQIIPLTGKNLARARAAAADAVASYEQARREQLDVLAQTRTSYFRLLNANAQLELNRKNLTSLRQIAEVSRSRYEVGKASAAEPLEGEVEASKLLESEQDILRNISAEQSQLNVLMNRDAFAPLGQPEQTKVKSIWRLPIVLRSKSRKRRSTWKSRDSIWRAATGFPIRRLPFKRSVTTIRDKPPANSMPGFPSRCHG